MNLEINCVQKGKLFKGVRIRYNMAKFICLPLQGGSLPENSYKGPSGTLYTFRRDDPTIIKLKEDVEFFTRCGNGSLFKRTDIVEKVKDTVKRAVKKEVIEIPERKSLTEKELFDLTRKEQAKLIKELSGVNTIIPKYEKNRVKLLLKLQK